jgi:ubiquinone/menaquinone biosynthesis C-methylase UbiE
MSKALPFNEYVGEYEEWFKKYPFVFKSEVAAIKKLLPKGTSIHGIEIGMGTGRFARALGIKDGIEPSGEMRSAAEQRGVFAVNAVAEHLPYKPKQFDFVLMNFCVSYFNDVQLAFAEASRVLKKDGILIVAFIEKNSRIGKFYERRRPHSIFYKEAKFYTAENMSVKLKKAGFNNLEFLQTLFHNLDDIKTVEPAEPGYGKGSYILIKSTK